MDGRKPDVNYRIEQFPLYEERQTHFYLHRTEAAVIEVVGRAGERGANRRRLLDVGCGLGTQAAKLWLRGWEPHGMDASDSMLRLGQYRYRVVHKTVRAVRGIAENLPYRDSTFDAVMCQGAMDHFADPHAFVEEAARVLKPGGRLIIALANYESLSCRIGLTIDRLMGCIGVTTPPKYRFWTIPEDHTFRGSYAFLKRLARGRLRLLGMNGASMFLFLPPWRGFLETLPFVAASAVFRVVDRIAWTFPTTADVVIGVWQKEEVGGGVRWQEALAEWKRRSSAVPSYLGRR